MTRQARLLQNARRMNVRAVVVAFSLLLAASVFAQPIDPLRNLSGTAPATGPSPWHVTGDEGWAFFYGLDVHATYLTQTGHEGEERESEVFSTNWLGLGVHRAIGDRAFVLARGRVSLEPYTIDEDGYGQFFQYVSNQAGGHLPVPGNQAMIDRMRPQDLFGEAAVQFGYRPSESSLLSVYAGLVGQPALGAAPWQLRASGVDFAEAPFAYDIQESFQTATSVVTGQFATRWLSVEGSVFHAARPSEDFTNVDTGGIDSNSFRVTVMPSRNFSIQASRGKLGEDSLEREITSASLSYGSQHAAVTALYTMRDSELRAETETAYGIEVALRGGRNTFMVRAEHVDRPEGFPLEVGAGEDVATHYTAGYIFDLMNNTRYRGGLGVNIDYRTQTREIEHIYGHKPQGIYAFFRLRTQGN